MQNFPSLNMSRGLATVVFFRCATFVEYNIILLQKLLSLQQMQWLVVIKTTATLCLGGLSCLNLHKLQNIQNTLAHVVTNHRKYAPILKQLHWLRIMHKCMFKTDKLVCKFLHSGSPSYFQPFLSFSSCSYSTRRSHPDRQYLTVRPFHSLVFKSVKHFDHSFAFDASKIWNELPYDVSSAASVASFRKKIKSYLFAKAYPPQPLLSPCVSLV